MSQNISQNSRGRGGGNKWQKKKYGGYNKYNNRWKDKGNNNKGGSSHSSQAVGQPVNSNTNCKYKKWPVYMIDDGYIQISELGQRADILYDYFQENLHQFDKESIEEKEEVFIDYQALIHDPDLKSKIPSLARNIKDEPVRTLSLIGVTLHQAFLEDQFNSDEQSIPVFFDVPLINARLLNYEPMTLLKNLKANYFGKLVSIRGTVVRVSNIKPLVTKMAFKCNSCGEEQILNFHQGKYISPTSCINFECRGKTFAPQRSSKYTETVDWQNIKIQEIMLDEQREAGRIPRTVECELTYGLVDSCTPGDMITVTGVVKVTTAEENGIRNKDKSMYFLYIHAVTISNSKEVKDGANEHGATDFTMKELYAIQEIQCETNLFRLIVGSLCPAIYGHELVKAGLVLALFGGTQKYMDEKNNIPVRGDPHVLVVGDPGLGKSQMLQAVSNVAPRGVYVCGNTTTTSGLTVTLTKESGSGDYALEAGALVLGDRGCCCIDEFDKMGNQHQALLEAMEQQSISIAKAGIVCSLPARTSIIAAANPVGGHYNKAKTVSENLKMNSALLSRFDLVFILLDKADEELDSILSEHVMSLHSEHHRSSSNRTVTVERGSENADSALQQWNSDKPLSERLKVNRKEQFDAIPSQLLRKYVQYARKYVHPKLSTEAATVLQEFYLHLRKKNQGANSTPITTRQLEALIRLTEARSRLELREKATAQDAMEVVEIMKNSMVDTFSDELGVLDYTRSQNGSGMSKRAQCKKFIGELSRISEREGNSLFNVDQMYRIATQLKLQPGNFDDFISSLNNQNFLLKKGPRLYQLQTASCL